MKQIRIERSYARLGFDVWIADFTEDRVKIVKPITAEIQDMPQGFLIPEPTFTLRHDDMLAWTKAFLEGIEEAGLADRIREDKGVLASTREHLKDIQKISDRLLAIVERTTA